MPIRPHLIFAIAALASATYTYATPLPTPSLDVPLASATAPASSTCNDIQNCRTMWDIIWGCVSTIFLCTWVSYHPDVPEATHTERRIFFTRVISVLYALLAPELLLAKALHDYIQVVRDPYSIHGTFSGTSKALPLLYAECSIRLDSNALILRLNGGIRRCSGRSIKMDG